MIGSWTLVTPPVAEPVTLDELKSHLYVSHSDDDALLTLYLTMARAAVEAETWRAILTQTWDLFLSAWPADGVIELPRSPLQSVTSITYRDSDNVTTTLAAATYEVDTASEPGRVVLAYGQNWPAVTLAASHPIRVRFVAGWPDAASVPGMIKAALLLQAGELYVQREAVSDKPLAVAPAVARMIGLAKVRW